jgi:hypothetical protein
MAAAAGMLVDAAASTDAAVAVQCLPFPADHDLFVYDTQGPATLVGSNSFEVARELTGPVMQQGIGIPDIALPSSGPLPERLQEFRFLRFGSSGRSWIIALRGIASFGVSDGAEVSAQLRYRDGDFSPTFAGLTLRVDGQLAFYYALGGAVASLAPPAELSIEQAAATCREEGDCGAWSSYNLRVRDTGMGAAQELAPLEQKTVGRFRVTHGGDSQQVPSQKEGGCSDWFVSHSEVIAQRSELLVSPRSNCRMSQSSSLAGVRIELAPDVPCRFSLSQAAAGIEIPYTVVVDAAVNEVVREHTSVSACTPANMRPADLFTFEELSGNLQQYAIVDVGNCGGSNSPAMTLAAGRYPHVFRWDGVNWSGPSDTGNPKGAAFPSGAYTLRLRAAGTSHNPNGDNPLPFELLTALEITLVP